MNSKKCSRTAAAWRYCFSAITGQPVKEKESDPLSEKLFEEYIVSRYAEPQRFYHTLNHIEQMLFQWEGFVKSCRAHHDGEPSPTTLASSSSSSSSTLPWEEQLRTIPQHPQKGDSRLFEQYPKEWLIAPEGTEEEKTLQTIPKVILYLSILFHDAVYDPKSSRNEEDSVALFQQFWNGLRTQSGKSGSASSSSLFAHAAVEEYVRKEVSRYILLTVSHLSEEPVEALKYTHEERDARCLPSLWACFPPSTKPYRLEHVFLDLDLSVLGSGDQEEEKPQLYYYQRDYAALIEKEYVPFVGQSVFREKRGEFLNSFLKEPQWYKTPYFFFMLEDRARLNVMKEWKALTSAS